MATPKLPAFGSLLKSRDVEDPVNLWLHRPLAYGFVALVYRSPITPNQITLLAMVVGLAAAACFIHGSEATMVWGGVLLWTSAILDGADGILARAQRKFSELGRALDGTADVVVAAATVAAAGYHLWVTKHDPVLMAQLLVTTGATVLHVYLYDFYKESYLQMTNPDWDGKPERVDEVQQRLARVKREKAGFAAIVASQLYVDLIRAQTRIVAFTDPFGSREALRFNPSPEAAEIYRRHNRLPIQLWALISLAPHSYLMSIFAMLDRLDLYLLGRLSLGNILFVVVLLWQRRASRLTRAELERIGQGPVRLAEASHAPKQQ
jgi:phosphatidylglycerophosphate synthase